MLDAEWQYSKQQYTHTLQQWLAVKDFSQNLLIWDKTFHPHSQNMLITVEMALSRSVSLYACVTVCEYAPASQTGVFVCCSLVWISLCLDVLLPMFLSECVCVCVSAQQMEVDSHHWEISIPQCTGSGAKWGRGSSSSNEEPITVWMLKKSAFPRSRSFLSQFLRG